MEMEIEEEKEKEEEAIESSAAAETVNVAKAERTSKLNQEWSQFKRFSSQLEGNGNRGAI